MREPGHTDTVPTAWLPHWLVIAFLSAVLGAGFGQVASRTSHESTTETSNADASPSDKQLARSSAFPPGRTAADAVPAIPLDSVPSQPEPHAVGQDSAGQAPAGPASDGTASDRTPQAGNRPQLTGEPKPGRQ